MRTVGSVAGLAFLMAMIGYFFFLTDTDQSALLNTIKLSLAAAAIAIPIAMLTAVSVAGGSATSASTRAVVLILIALSMLPPYLNVSSWDAAFGKLGWLTSAQGQILQPLLSKWSAAIWVHAVGLVPPFTLLFFWGLLSRSTLEEQARMELSSDAVFLHITLRQSLPLVVACVLWAIIVCSREIAVTDLYQIGTLAEQVYLGYSLGQVNSMVGRWSAEEVAAAGALTIAVRGTLFLFLISVSVSFFSLLTLFSQTTQSMIFTRSLRWQSKRRRSWQWTSVLVVLLVLVVVPVTNLFFQLGTSVASVDGRPVQQWNAGNGYAAVVRAVNDFYNAFIWSGLIAVLASSAVVFVAALLCFWAKTNRTGWWTMVLLTSMAAGLSGPDIGTGITYFFSQCKNPGLIWVYDQTVLPAVMANVVFCWPLAVVIIWFAMLRTPQDQLESAELDRAAFLRRTYEFGWLQNRNIIVGVGVLLVAICFSELSASQMVLPPGVETVAQVTLGNLHAGVNQATAALSLLTMGLIVTLVAIAWIISQGFNRETAGQRLG